MEMDCDAVYRIDGDGSVKRILTQPDIQRPNGIAVTQDSKHLYVVDSCPVVGGNRKIWHFDLDDAGQPSNQTLVWDFGEGRGGDGMRLDINGNLYIAAGLTTPRGPHEAPTVPAGIYIVTPDGDIANWMIPGKMVKGMGGAMDLVTSSNNIIVAMTHTNRQGQSKLLKRCTLPITGVSCVKKIVTDLAVIEVTRKGFKLTEVAPGVSEDEIINSTDADLIIDKNLRTMVL